VFTDTKNRRGMAGSGKAVSSIVEFPTFTGGYSCETFTGSYSWETCGASVQEMVPVNTNYRNVFSITLFALADANYIFLFVNAAC
jgi:hypothetical protein